MSRSERHSSYSRPAVQSVSGLTIDRALALFLLLVCAIVFGGGGVSAALGNLVVVTGAIALLAFSFDPVARFVRSGPRGLVVLTGLTLLLPLLQLVPLPPATWRGLPGRDLVSASLGLAGASGWYPLSVDGGRTLVAFLGLVAPATVICVGWTIDAARLVWLQRAMIAAGVAIALYGTLNVIEPGLGDLYSGVRPMGGMVVGTFADRNAAAMFFIGCLLLLCALPRWERRGPKAWLAVAVAAILVTCVVLTRSRTGLALTCAPTALAAWRLWSGIRSPAATEGKIRPWIGALMALAVVAGGFAILATGQGRSSLSRFDDSDGMRAEMREDSMFAARRYWPVGAGMGTFDEVFQIDESLEYVSPRRAGRAHMDYLELAIEAGAIGLLLLAGWFAWLGRMGWKALRQRGAWPARGAALILIAIGCQSLVLFPLRSQALLCFAALAVVILARSPVAGADRDNAR